MTIYFFDLDGTLLDSNGIWLDIDVEFLRRHGVDPVPEDYTDYVTHHPIHDSAEYTRRYFHLSLTAEEIVAAWRDMAHLAYARQLELKPGARAFLERAVGAGRRCALLTSCMPDLCRAALDCHRLSPLLERVFTTAELGLEKRANLRGARSPVCPPGRGDGRPVRRRAIPLLFFPAPALVKKSKGLLTKAGISHSFCRKLWDMPG